MIARFPEPQTNFVGSCCMHASRRGPSFALERNRGGGGGGGIAGLVLSALASHSRSHTIYPADEPRSSRLDQRDQGAERRAYGQVSVVQRGVSVSWP